MTQNMAWLKLGIDLPFLSCSPLERKTGCVCGVLNDTTWLGLKLGNDLPFLSCSVVFHTFTRWFSSTDRWFVCISLLHVVFVVLQQQAAMLLADGKSPNEIVVSLNETKDGFAVSAKNRPTPSFASCCWLRRIELTGMLLGAA
jgi:hypothetical protein